MGWIYDRYSSNTWLEYLVIRAVCHIEATQLDGNLIASGLAHCEGHFDYVGLWFLQNFLCNRDVQSQFNVSDVDPQSNRSMRRERLAILVEQLRRQKHKFSIIQYRKYKNPFYTDELSFATQYTWTLKLIVCPTSCGSFQSQDTLQERGSR